MTDTAVPGAHLSRHQRQHSLPFLLDQPDNSTSISSKRKLSTRRCSVPLTPSPSLTNTMASLHHRSVSLPYSNFLLTLQIKSSDTIGPPRRLLVPLWCTVNELKHCFHERRPSRLFLGARELDPRKSLRDNRISHNSLITRWVSVDPRAFNQLVILSSPRPEHVSLLHDLVHQCQTGLAKHQVPILSSQGTTGAYFLAGAGEQVDPVAVFKPEDEEAHAPNNPRGLEGELGQPGIRPGLYSGEAARREVAAYALDHKGFAKVPVTVRACLEHASLHYATPCSNDVCPKPGSLQQFIQAHEVAEDYAPCLFACEDVHKIAILDIRLLNADRHGSNILVKTNNQSIELYPIDHGISISLAEIGWCDWVWLDWPQAHQPFSSQTLEYIQDLDLDNDDSILRNLLIREECIRRVHIAAMVLKRGAQAQMTLHQIAFLIARQHLDRPSPFEEILVQADRILRQNLHKFLRHDGEDQPQDILTLSQHLYKIATPLVEELIHRNQNNKNRE